ncbi:SDR family NAD(P)-dependent oxidoreductase [Carbonactinospora thermoautotrophica]|uniref:Short-chain dehydrogenase n=1 Tax=Carbonactinospora thermoautotrophica TaxID=1469144 RepID=A0A132MKZ5_9ACTN|nr:SDR family oxidoreductase [Carbonactinospora thermoautotrophica]KWW97785.1 short-chain dehydrogenase [Carbonactinospora thermoautotrophica]KWW98508.1 Short-chain dehydrogenase/reductase SDR [Carbonactinospora thermoautotrophica]KWX08621.1 short-chain dehydrogenase [Carbonactinospora thermoautotrophica]MCX9193621.1 SDR family NAD(P)-dependent oxidoreductase [Carbonactinospora thermoautotrophica]
MTTALITGATAGIGAAFARRLAAARYDLILVARDTARLDQTAAGLRDTYGVPVEVMPADLSDRARCQAVEERLRDPDRPVDVLINNAGFGTNASFLRSPIEDEERMLDVLVRAVLRLTHAALPGMVARGRGAIINVSSVAGFLPRGTYGAAKAWVTSFTEGLAAEVADKGVKVIAVCPGFVHTEFHQRAGIETDSIPDWMWLEADEIVEGVLKDLRRGIVVSVPSAQYKALTTIARCTPRGVLARVSRQFGRRR